MQEWEQAVPSSCQRELYVPWHQCWRMLWKVFALRSLIKNTFCGCYFKNHQEGVVGGKMRESEKERKSEWLLTVSLFPQITLLFCSIINAPEGWEAAGRPEIALLFFFYILLDFLKIQAAFLPRSGISRASCLYAQTWAGDNQPGKPSRHVLGRGSQQSPFTLQNREDVWEEWGDFIWQEYLAARIQGEGTAVTCSPSSCWGLSSTPAPRVGIARSHPISLSNNFRWDGLPNLILTYY